MAIPFMYMGILIIKIIVLYSFQIVYNGHEILNEYSTSYWQKKQWYYTLLRNYVKTCDKQVLQQQTHITFFMT